MISVSSARDLLRAAISPDIDKAWLPRARVTAAIQAMIDAKVAGGQHVTVTAADTIETGLGTLLSATASFEDDPADANLLVSVQIGDQAGAPDAGSIIIKTWKTDGVDPTPAPATGFGKKVNWVAVATTE